MCIAYCVSSRVHTWRILGIYDCNYKRHTFFRCSEICKLSHSLFALSSFCYQVAATSFMVNRICIAEVIHRDWMQEPNIESLRWDPKAESFSYSTSKLNCSTICNKNWQCRMEWTESIWCIGHLYPPYRDMHVLHVCP